MTRRSATCFGKRSEKPLVEYTSQSKAQKAADYVSRRYNTTTRPYKCHTCGFWHLSSSNSTQQQQRHTTNENKRNCADGPSSSSSASLSWRSSKKQTEDIYKNRKSSTCFGHVSQKPLTEYPSRSAAERGADIVFDKYGDTTTEAYKCKRCPFWHVSSEKEQHNQSYEHGRGILTERSQKSTVCFGKHNGVPLTEYRSLDDASKAALCANTRFGNNLVPYHCSNCTRWHLSPEDRGTISFSPELYCRCKDSHGCPKSSYPTREDARRRSEILYREEGLQRILTVYQCPEGMWHLTSSQPRGGRRQRREKHERQQHGPLRPLRRIDMAPPIL